MVSVNIEKKLSNQSNGTDQLNIAKDLCAGTTVFRKVLCQTWEEFVWFETLWIGRALDLEGVLHSQDEGTI